MGRLLPVLVQGGVSVRGKAAIACPAGYAADKPDVCLHNPLDSKVQSGLVLRYGKIGGCLHAADLVAGGAGVRSERLSPRALRALARLPCIQLKATV